MRKIYIVLLITVASLLICCGYSYSLWFLKDEQAGGNKTTIDCFEVEFSENNDSLLVSGDYPKTNEDGLNTSPYSFTLKNVCDNDAFYEVKVELLDDNTMSSEYIKVALDDQYSLLSDDVNEDNIYTIGSGFLSISEEREFEFKQWVDESCTNDISYENVISTKVSVVSVPSEAPYTEEILNRQDPVLNSGFIPVVIEDNGDVVIADVHEEWYNYENKEWANAVIVNDSVYNTSKPGTVIPMNVISGMYVWIPRYQYDPDTIVDDDHAIDIDFVDSSDEAHPAFTVDGYELNGFWVAKFELRFTLDANNYRTIYSKPDMVSYYGYTVSDFFNAVVKMNGTMGLDDLTEFHLVKNTEWGAVAYLSQSLYGVCDAIDDCSKIENNNYIGLDNSNVVTGCGGNDTSVTVDSETVDICPIENRWTTENGMHASTTRNITGIYDMVGGDAEVVMANMADMNGNFQAAASGFTDSLDEKYYDAYPYSRYTTNFDNTFKGDALYELKVNGTYQANWNNDHMIYLSSERPFLYRGGFSTNGSGAGIWYCYSSTGKGFINTSTRVSIWSYK